MNYDSPTFKWDSYGLTAYKAMFNNVGGQSVFNGSDVTQFVRFDQHGIYGINDVEGTLVNGGLWRPETIQEITDNATFALTWEGLKVTGSDGVVAHLGKQKYSLKEQENDPNPLIKDAIMRVVDKDGENTFVIGNDGKVVANGIKIIGAVAEDNSTIPSTKNLTEALNTITTGGDNYLIGCEDDEYWTTNSPTASKKEFA
jgi:hypothetical protein